MGGSVVQSCWAINKGFPNGSSKFRWSISTGQFAAYRERWRGLQPKQGGGCPLRAQQGAALLHRALRRSRACIGSSLECRDGEGERQFGLVGNKSPRYASV